MKVPREDMIDRKLELVVDKLENKVLSMDNSILQLQETVNRNYDVLLDFYKSQKEWIKNTTEIRKIIIT